MLEGLRAVQNTWAGKAILAIVMGLIVVSFVIWGIGDIFRGIGADQVAKVGSVDISTAAYRQAYQNELQALQRRARRPITNAEAHSFGLDAQVLSRMISDAVLDDRVKALGLAISDTDMAKAITADPAFAGPGGAFDRGRFTSLLRNEGYSEQTFVREQRHVYLRQELVQALVGDLTVPKALLEAQQRYAEETRSIDDVVLPASAVEPIPVPDEATLVPYYDARKQSFEAPQYRKLVVLSVSPDSVAKPSEVTDADARTLYDEVKAARFGSPERRTLQQIVFPNAEEAAAAAAKLKAGTSFADLLSERKLTPKDVDLGTVTRPEIFDPAVAAAAFALPDGGTSDPVKGAFGSVLVHVAAIEAAGIKPFDEVAAQLKQEIATHRAGDELRTLHDRVEDARTSGKPLTEAARAAGLEARTIDAVDAAGLDKDGKPVEGLADRDALLKAAFASDIGVDNDTVRGRGGAVTWFEVAAIDPARTRPLSEVRTAVEAAWRRDEVAKRLADKAAELVKQLDAGRTMSELAAANGNLPVGHVDGVKRTGGGSLPGEALAAVFDGPVGHVGTAPQGSDSRILFKVTASTMPPFDPTAPAMLQAEGRIRTALAEGVLGAYLSRVGAQIGAKVNQEALRSAAGASE